MASLDYVQIPSCATRLHSGEQSQSSRHAPKVASAPPKSEYASASTLSSYQQPQSPPKQPFNIPSMVLASGVIFPATNVGSPRGGKAGQLLSTREPLTLPTTTAHFRRFAARCGPIFWLQDRVEEVVTWKRGWKVTTAWMLVYTFICCYPRLLLLIPHVILLTILLSAHAYRQPSPSRVIDTPSPPPYSQPAEGSTEWFANLQGIQNLMGVVADTHDAILYKVIPHLMFSTMYTYTLLAFTAITFFLLVLALPLIPLQPTFLVLGWSVFAFFHPVTQTLLPIIIGSHYKQWHTRLTRFVDDDRLEDRHWQPGSVPLREVELWENERFGGAGANAGWSKAFLRPGERKGWTRGRDGWSETKADGSGDVSNLTFQLAPSWAFVETEDWRKDLEASWTDIDSDADGWIYTNDSWLEPHSAPLEEWKTKGVTRRRRWTRRICYDDSLQH